MSFCTKCCCVYLGVSGNLDEQHCKLKQTIKSIRYGFYITKHFCN